jgi:cephalosporin hydroxylase
MKFLYKTANRIARRSGYRLSYERLTSKKLNRNELEETLQKPISELLKIIQARTAESTYFGVQAVKNPLDFWVYQEIICSVKPNAVIEIGTRHGGTTLALAHLLDHLQQGIVVSVDLDHALETHVNRSLK